MGLCFALPSLASTVRLDDTKWRLWCDTSAEWKQDKLYLPGDLDLPKLPVNPPTIGWDKLYATGIEVSLPSTVEEHFWGKFGKRAYTDDEYYFAIDDHQVLNGSYEGVSWWWTSFEAPKDIEGKLAFLKFDGVRLRAEVFLNEELVGYDIVGETPFDCNITGKIKPGRNTLAVRVTNPGGRMDWSDGGTFKWGSYRIPLSHGFGGINRGVRIELKPRIYLDGVFVMNRLDPHAVGVRSEIVNTTGKSVRARLRTAIAGTPVSNEQTIEAPPGVSQVDVEISYPEAGLWSLESPDLYTLQTSLAVGESVDTCETSFGFRSFECRGIGSDAHFLLNGKRIVLRSAISWGFWGINGLWPDETMARREIEDAKRIGLNCLNSHRCISKPITLDLQDQLGLLRYEEPGAGGNAVAEDEFARNYAAIKTLRMVKRDRNHPSLIIYCLQNEWDTGADNPRLADILSRVHDLDPSRPIIAKSGVPPEGQSYYLPFEKAMRKDDGTGYSGWRDEHTVGGPGMYVDSLYEGPDKWSHRSDDTRQIVFWGEMLGAGTPDNLWPIVDSYKRTGRTGYDRDDEMEQYAAFDQFLDSRGFRKAFPTLQDLTRSIGNKEYCFWGRIVENGRISDPVDCMVVSGWESTTIENHSGLVDCHRYLKGDPELISYYCRPLHLAIKSRHLVIECGDPLVTDLHIVNELAVHGDAQVTFDVSGPDGKTLESRGYPVKIAGGNVFGGLLVAGIETRVYDAPGYYTLKAVLRQAGATVVEGREWIFVTDSRSAGTPATGAIRDYDGLAKSFLAGRGVRIEDYWPTLGKLDYIIMAGDSEAGVHGGTQRTDQAIENTSDDILYQTQVEQYPDDFWAIVNDIPNGRYEVTLKFAELALDAPGMRVFDLAINDKTVLSDFDIFKAAGSRFRALDRVFEIEVTDHRIKITSPRTAKNAAVLNAFRISGEGVTISVNCQGPQYTDSTGAIWSGNWKGVDFPEDVFRRVREDGTTLVFWTNGPDLGERVLRSMDAREIVKLSGSVGNGRMPWMGCWTAVREHPLLKGLPVNTALNWEWQTSGGNGFIVDGDGVEWIAAFGRDHDRNIGASLATVPYGKGEIIVNCIGDCYGSLAPGRESAPATPIARRMLLNAVEYAADRAATRGSTQQEGPHQ